MIASLTSACDARSRVVVPRNPLFANTSIADLIMSCLLPPFSISKYLLTLPRDRLASGNIEARADVGCLSASLVVRYGWVIEQLDQDSIRVVEIEGSSTVAMGFGRIRKRNVELQKPFRPNINVTNFSYNKADMVDALNGARILPFGKPVNGKVVCPGGQVDVVFVRLPLDAHTQNRTVKVNGSFHVANIQRNMSQS